jgi:hypothetical protein
VTAALSVVLADVGARAVDEHGGGWHPLTSALRALDRLVTIPVDEDLRAWAVRIGTPDAAVPLPGTGLRAAPYPGLLWSGERSVRAGLGADVRLTLVGLAVGAENVRTAADLSRAVHAGLAVADALDRSTATVAHPSALATTGVVAAAVCAAVLAGVPRADLGAVIDIAGSLMAVTPPDGRAGPWPGHSGAAGWLAVRTWSSGLTGMSDGIAHTLATVAGPGAAQDPLADRPHAVDVGALLERLR